jgi:hypothetical protein
MLSIGCWLYWVLAVGYWLLAIGFGELRASSAAWRSAALILYIRTPRPLLLDAQADI